MARKLIPLTSPDDGYSKELLGGKGYNLWKMAQAGVNVPPAMVISTDVCREFMADPGKVAKWVREDAIPAIKMYLSTEMGYLPLVSVRSGSKFSMPGMMDTILNVGLTVDNYDDWSSKLGPVCASSCAERLDSMYSSVVGEVLPKEADDQLFGAIIAVFKSWNNDRAKLYRKMNGISDDLGTAVTVQAMVFGNYNNRSATGVLFTRDPSTGVNEVVGEYLIHAQGEDIVAGVRTPLPLSSLAEWDAAIANELMTVSNKLEIMNRDMQDIEFTVQDGKLYILQTRDAKRTAQATVAVAYDLWSAGMLSTDEMISRVKAKDVLKATCPVISPSWLKANPPNAKGLAASPGVVTGKAVFSSAEAVEQAKFGPVVMITKETDPDDLAGMAAAVGLLTGRGGMTCHAAVVARGMNKPAVVGCSDLNFSDLSDAAGHPSVFGVLKTVTIEGATGNVWFGAVPEMVGGAGGVVKDFLAALSGHFQYYEVATKAETIVNHGCVVLPAYALSVAEFEAEAVKMAAKVDDLIIDLRDASVDPHSAPLALLWGLPERETVDKVMALIPLNLKCKVIGTTSPLMDKLVSAGYTLIPHIGSLGDFKTVADGTMVTADHAALAGDRNEVKLLALDKGIKSLNCLSEVDMDVLVKGKGKVAMTPMAAVFSFLS